MAARQKTIASYLGLAWLGAALAWQAVSLSAQQVPRRIVSLVPAVTEMLFSVGAGPQIVAVSSFDAYPPEVKQLPRVGALLDPNVERILSLKPDLVVVYGSQTDLKQQLTRVSIPIFDYRHAGLGDVSTTIRTLGERTGHAVQAGEVVTGIQQGLADIRKRVGDRPRPRVLLIFGREAGTLRGIYASGGTGFLDDMLRVAGGDNVFADIQREAVEASTELILSRRPDVILEIRTSDNPVTPATLPTEVAVWRALASVPAVKNDRVQFVTDDRIVVPGPRVVDGTRAIAEALHPGAFK
jgi:iron complex transport system substrate-binding protein